MSKFQYGKLYGVGYEYAINAEKFTLEKAIEIFENECKPGKVGKEMGQYVVCNAFVRHQPCIGWWVEFSKDKRGSCPAWVFRKRQISDKI